MVSDTSLTLTLPWFQTLDLAQGAKSTPLPSPRKTPCCHALEFALTGAFTVVRRSLGRHGVRGGPRKTHHNGLE